MLVMIGQEAGVRAHGVVAERVRAVIEAIGHRYARLTGWMRSAAPRHIVWRAAAALLMVPVVAGATLLQHVKYDRADLPDMEPLVRFEPPTIGHLYDARGEVLLELAREYRWVVQYPEIPVTLREAVLAAEDKNFFSHGGVDFGALPRVAGKAFLRSVAASRRASEEDGRLRIKIVFPQGGSTHHPAARAGLLPERHHQGRGPGRAAAADAGRARAWPRSWACPPRTSSAARSRRCGCRCGWRRTSGDGSAPARRPRSRSWPATRRSSTWATAATASRRRPSTTSTSRSPPTSSGTPTRRPCWPASRSRRRTTRPRRATSSGRASAATTCCG